MTPIATASTKSAARVQSRRGRAGHAATPVHQFHAQRGVSAGTVHSQHPEAAKAHDFPLDKLIFETLESEHIDNYRHLTHILREYREFGFKTAIDDFGAGYSGLNLLADFQPDLIKLDMALIRDVDQDRARQAIVRGVVMMCSELNVTVIAEGIESAGERDFLADCGIFLMQGYWFARPAFQALAEVRPAAWIR